MPKRLLAIGWGILLVLAVVLAVRALGRAGLVDVYHAVIHADGRLVGLATLLALIQIVCKSERWRLMLSPIAKLPPVRLYYYLLLAYGASMLLPSPSGTAARVYLLKRNHDVPAMESTAVIAAEKLFEGIGLMVVVAPLPLLLSLPGSLRLTITALVAGGLLVTGVSVILGRRARRGGGGGGRWRRLAPAADCVSRPSIFIPASVLSVVSQLLNCAVIVLLFRAVGITVPVAASALVILVLAVALLIPFTPGHAVTLEAGAVAALAIVGVSSEPALAFGLVYHAVHLVPVALVVLTGLKLLGEVRRNPPAVSVLAAPDTEPDVEPGQSAAR